MRYRALLVVLVVHSMPLAAAAAGEMFDASGAVRQALLHNADIVSAQAEVTAAEAREQQASLFFQANPEVEAAGGPRRDGDTIAEYSVELSQQVEIGGQRAARLAAARENLAASRARLAWRRVDVAAAVRELFGRALAAQRLLTVARDSEAMAEQSLQAADKRFRAGDISRLEINATRVERGRSAQERGRAEQRAAVALAELQMLLALPSETTLVLRGELAEAPAPPLGDLQALMKDALEMRPDLRAQRAEVEAARAQSRLAEREWLPKPRIGAAFEHEEGADIVQGTVGIDLPVFNRNQAARGAAAASVVKAEEALRASRQRAEQEIRLAHHRVRVAEEAAAAYAGEVATAMGENLALSNRAYAASQIDFAQLLLIRRESLAAQRDYIDGLEELNAARAQLNRALGRE